MRRVSKQRRRIVALSSSVAAMSGVVPLLIRRHPVDGWMWLGMMAGLVVGAIILMVRVQRDEGCA